MKPAQAKPEDERLVHDETAAAVDRGAALSRLAADGRLDLESVAGEWLHDETDPGLVSEGLRLVLTYWPQSPYLDAYVESTILCLAIVEESDMRRDAASSLGAVLERAPEYAERVIPELLMALDEDEDESVQRACYRALLEQVAPGQSAVLLAPDEVPFDQSRDVRRDLLEPLRARYGSEPRKPQKSRPGDEQLIHDETQDWGERGSALSRLAADGHDLESVARDWLHGDDLELAVEALGHLLIYCCDSPRAHEYVNTGIGWLKTMSDPGLRSGTVTCLKSFLALAADRRLIPDHRDEILSALLHALQRDEDPIVQESCYEVLLEQLGLREEIEKLPHHSVRFFDRDIDVRWELLAPLRGRHVKN